MGRTHAQAVLEIVVDGEGDDDQADERHEIDRQERKLRVPVTRQIEAQIAGIRLPDIRRHPDQVEQVPDNQAEREAAPDEPADVAQAALLERREAPDQEQADGRRDEPGVPFKGVPDARRAPQVLPDRDLLELPLPVIAEIEEGDQQEHGGHLHLQNGRSS